jgi:hypothetical protein
MHNVLSSNEISDILNDSIVKRNKANLSVAQKVVKFSFPLSDDMRNKLSTRLAMSLSHTVPMRWIKGDTPLHTDKGENYQPHSLSTGSGGSGVRNCRHKQRKT